MKTISPATFVLDSSFKISFRFSKSSDKPKETTFGNILGRYLNWQEHEKKYGNIYNPRYENMKETLKQDINRELSNSNISNKNRASYESMLRKLGD